MSLKAFQIRKGQRSKIIMVILFLINKPLKVLTVINAIEHYIVPLFLILLL